MEKKAFELGVSWQDDILHIMIAGQVTKENADMIAREVIEAANERRPKKLLIDCRNVKGRLGITDTFFSIEKYDLTKYVTPRTAVIDNAENLSLYSFHEMAMRSRGVNIRFFTDADEAVSWLNVDPAPSAPSEGT